MADKKQIFVIAAGGTGGHIFPAEALASYILDQGHTPVLITDRRYDNYQGTLGKIQTYRILSSSPSGNIVHKLKALIFISLGTLQAWLLLLKLKPKATIGFGGYPSFPTMIAASMTSCKTIIHEQNAILGRVNRFLAKFIDYIGTTFTNVRGIPEGKAVLTGNPVRPQVLAIKDTAYEAPKETFNLLITGGSQGATIFSKIVPNAILDLPKELQQRLFISQQCRKEDIDEVAAQYKKAGIKAEVSHFFTDIPERLAQSHLVICRSGASTLAELTTVGRPSILVPYLHAMDDHQTANAKHLDDAGGAWVILQPDFTSKALSSKLHELMENPNDLVEKAENAKQVGHPQATEKLYEHVMNIIQKGN